MAWLLWTPLLGLGLVLYGGIEGPVWLVVLGLALYIGVPAFMLSQAHRV